MKRFTVISLFAVILATAFTSAAFAKPPSGDSNPSDLGNSTVDVSQVIRPH